MENTGGNLRHSGLTGEIDQPLLGLCQFGPGALLGAHLLMQLTCSFRHLIEHLVETVHQNADLVVTPFDGTKASAAAIANQLGCLGKLDKGSQQSPDLDIADRKCHRQNQ